MRNSLLVEIFEDYKTLTTDEERVAYENELIDLVWERGKPYSIQTVQISFDVNKEIVGEKFAKLFKPYTRLSYTTSVPEGVYQRDECLGAGWLNAIRLQIGFIYSSWYDKQVCNDKQYVTTLFKPKYYYFKVVERKRDDYDEIVELVNGSMDLSKKYYETKIMSKPMLSWDEYVQVVNDTIRQCLKVYSPLDEYIKKDSSYMQKYIGGNYDEDNFVNAYFRKSLRNNTWSYVRTRDKVPHSLRKKKITEKKINERYGVCSRCGKTMIVKSNRQKYCKACKRETELLRHIKYNNKRKSIASKPDDDQDCSHIDGNNDN